jgi:hypothetical protein
MKNYLLPLYIFILSTCLNGQNLLNGPECVNYDSLHSRYLVSNYNNGSIIAIDSSGVQSYFKQRSGHALGNCITGNSIYVSIGNTILGLNLDNPDDTTMYLPIAGTTQLDGMTADDNDNLYVIASMTAKIYKVNILTQTYSLYVASGISARPQDIVFDREHNRLLVCSWYDNSPLQSIDLMDSTVTDLVVTTGNCDGLALDGKGNCYFSTWTNNSVYCYDSNFVNPPAMFSNGHSGPSNICYNARDNIVAVPNYNLNSVTFVSVSPVSLKEEEDLQIGMTLFQNYPNPFNSATKIVWQSPESGLVTLKVYNILGSEISVLMNEYRPAGRNEVEFDAASLPGGVYLYRITSGGYSKTRKMVYLK